MAAVAVHHFLFGVEPAFELLSLDDNFGSQAFYERFRLLVEHERMVDDSDRANTLQPHSGRQCYAIVAVWIDADGEKVATIRGELQKAQVPRVNDVEVPGDEDDTTAYARALTDLSNLLVAIGATCRLRREHSRHPRFSDLFRPLWFCGLARTQYHIRICPDLARWIVAQGVPRSAYRGVRTTNGAVQP